MSYTSKIRNVLRSIHNECVVSYVASMPMTAEWICIGCICGDAVASNLVLLFQDEGWPLSNDARLLFHTLGVMNISCLVCSSRSATWTCKLV